MSKIKSSDLFRSAYLICVGGALNHVEWFRDQRVIFIIEGEGLESKDHCYRSGQALVNPLRLREAINLLRDQIRKTENLKKGEAYGPRRHRESEARNLYHRGDSKKRNRSEQERTGVERTLSLPQRENSLLPRQ